MTKRHEIRSFAEAPLYAQIKREAGGKRMSMGNWLLVAAEEKLQRLRRRNRPSQGEAEECEVA